MCLKLPTFSGLLTRGDDEGVVRLFCFGLGYCAERLIARDATWRASGALRDPERASALRRAGFDAFAFEAAHPEAAMLGAVRAAQVLLVSAPPGPAGDPALQGLRAEMAAAGNLKRVVYLSSVGVYGDRGGGWVDEMDVPAPTSLRARLRLAAEDEWRAFERDERVPVDILRLAGIYGPDRNALVKMRAGAARRVIKRGHVFNRIHVDDIVEVVRRIVERAGAGETWNVADEEPAPPQDVVAFAAGLLGVAPPAEESLESAVLSPMARSFYKENRRVAVEKLRRELGYRWLYPSYREGLRALAAAGEGGAPAKGD
jgi:nucleoside-diphosphate-sugar epimerase